MGSAGYIRGSRSYHEYSPVPGGLSGPVSGDVADIASEGHTMPFPLWQYIPPTTAVRDLYETSLLACTDEPNSGILLRCSTGLAEGSTTVVHALAKRPNAVRMMGIDDDTQIAAQAQILLGDSRVHVVSIPHIAWKSLGGGLPRRTPIAVAIAVLTAVALSIPPVSLSVWVSVPVAALTGLLTWFLLRVRIPTRIGPPEAPPMAVDTVLERAMLSVSGLPRSGTAVPRSEKSSRSWAPPLS